MMSKTLSGLLMLRFAASPTRDMHLGDLRIALINFIISVQNKEPLIIRIEDTNGADNIEGKDKEILDLLDLFGVKYEQHIAQSTHTKYHRSMALQLLHDKKAFNCFCKETQLQKERDAAKAAKIPYRYSGTCADLPAELTIDNMNPFTVRLRKPLEDIIMQDLIHGTQTFTPDDIDSFIIMNQDKSATSNFANAVDDMISDISTVVSDYANLTESPKQVAVREALGYTKAITYAHLPPFLNKKGEAMSVNDKQMQITWLLEEGFLPSSITNYLLALNTTPPKVIFTLEEACSWFSLASVNSESTTFDIEALKEINRQHLLALDDVELSRYVGFADGDIGRVAKLYLQEISTLKALRPKIQTIFEPKTVPSTLENHAETLRAAITKAPHFETYATLENYLLEQTQLTPDAIAITLRILLTGSEDGPDLSQLYSHLKNYLVEIIK